MKEHVAPLRFLIVIDVTYGRPSDGSRTLDALARQVPIVGGFKVVMVASEALDGNMATWAHGALGDPAYEDIGAVVIETSGTEDALRRKRYAVAEHPADAVLFLNAGDTIDPTFLATMQLALDANPSAGWASPTRVEAVPRSRRRTPERFDVLGRFMRPVIAPGTVYRTRPWLHVTRRAPKPIGATEVLDEWLAQVRLMARGTTGLPVRDAVYTSHWAALASARLQAKSLALATYLTLRDNLRWLPSLWRARRTHRRDEREGHGRVPWYHPMWYPNRLQARIAARVTGTDAPVGLHASLLALAAFAPRRFIEAFTRAEESITLAELRCGFEQKPTVEFPLLEGHARSTPTILFAQTNWTVGGAERVVEQWMEAARGVNGARIVEATERETHDRPEVAEEHHHVIEDIRARFASRSDAQYSIEALGTTPLARLRATWSMICRERPDLIFLSGNAYVYALLPHIRRHFPEMKVIDILHNEWYDLRDWFNVASEYTEHLDERIVISEHWRDVLVDKYGERYERVQVHPNGIDTSTFSFDSEARRAARDRLGVADDIRLVGFVGRIQHQKNPGVFFELARQMAHIPSTQFVVVGDGPERQSLLDTYDDLKNLQYLGPTNDVASTMAAFDVVVFTSTFEGYPLTSLEAAAMGVPIIAPNIVGFREQIELGKIGLSYEPKGDRRVDAWSIRRILEERSEELRACASSARNFVVERHSLQALAPTRTRYLQEWLAAPRAHASRPKRKKLYLHIGTPKTGSTSIQYMLHHNREALRRQGILYPETLQYGYGHFPIAWTVLRNKRPIPAEARGRFADMEALEKQVRAFVQGLEQAREPTIVVSAENLAYADPRAVAELFAGFDVHIVVFLRRQDQFVESNYNQRVKMRGLKGPPLSLISNEKVALDYEALLDAWADAFGQDRVTVIPFERSTLRNGLERTFLAAVGGAWNERFNVAKQNPRISRDALAFLQSNPQLRLQQTAREYRAIVNALERYSNDHPDPPEHRHPLSPEERRMILERYEPRNASVAARFLSERGALFLDSVTEYEVPFEPYPGLSDEARVRIVEHLVRGGVRRSLLEAQRGHSSSGSSRAPARKRVHLHIGFHKTGSSTLQAFLASNRATLERLGYHYPSTGGQVAHHLLAKTYMEVQRGLPLPGHLLARFGSARAFLGYIEQRIAQDVAQPFREIVYSSEAFEAGPPGFVADLASHHDVRVVAFVRRQDVLLESQWSQRFKTALVDAARLTTFAETFSGDHAAKLKRWEAVVGLEAITVLPFEPAQLPCGLETHFLEALGIKEATDFTTVEARNRRLTRDAAVFLHEVRSRGVKLGSKRFQRLLRLLERYGDLHPDPPEWRYAFPPATRNAVLDKFRDSNAAVARRYLNRADGRLFIDDAPVDLAEPWAPYPGLEDHVRSDIVAFLASDGYEVERLQVGAGSA